MKKISFILLFSLITTQVAQAKPEAYFVFSKRFLKTKKMLVVNGVKFENSGLYIKNLDEAFKSNAASVAAIKEYEQNSTQGVIYTLSGMAVLITGLLKAFNKDGLNTGFIIAGSLVTTYGNYKSELAEFYLNEAVNSYNGVASVPAQGLQIIPKKESLALAMTWDF